MIQSLEVLALAEKHLYIILILSMLSCHNKDAYILSCEGSGCGCLKDDDCIITVCGPDVLTSIEDCFPDCNCSDGWPTSKKGQEIIKKSYADICPVDECAMNCEVTECVAHTTTAECHWGRCVAVVVSTAADSR